MSAVLIFCSLLAVLTATAYLYVQNLFGYWKRRGVPYLKPSFPFGILGKVFQQKLSLPEVLEEIYNKTDEPVIGVYVTVRPSLMVRDPQIVQDILIRDFSSFHTRGLNINSDVDLLADNILLQEGEKWKRSRNALSPTFTSGKLKSMFDTIITASNSLHKYVDQFAKSGETIEIRDAFARFATNVIAFVVFGIDVDCITDRDSAFRYYGKRFFEPTVKNAVRSNLSFLMPPLAKFLRLRFADKDVGDFMLDTIRKNLEYREKNNVVRKDFFQMLMQLRNTGKISDGDDWSATVSSAQKMLSLDEMTAHAFLFFVGGYESSSTTMSFCMYELAKDQHVQSKVYEEITEVLANNDGQLTYDSIGQMKYMEKCIDETLRMHPPFGALARKCTKDYKLADSNIVIEKGTSIIIPVSALHYDAKYYEQPKKFMPERFDEEAKAHRSLTYLPFGGGPRICLGLRLAKLQVKIALVTLLQKYHFELRAEDMNKELKLDPNGIAKTPIGGVNLHVKAR